MLSSKELKQQAKDSLRGRWGQAVLLNLIPTLIAIAIILIIAVPTACYLSISIVILQRSKIWRQTIPVVGQVVVAGSSLLSSVHCS